MAADHPVVVLCCSGGAEAGLSPLCETLLEDKEASCDCPAGQSVRDPMFQHRGQGVLRSGKALHSLSPHSLTGTMHLLKGNAVSSRPLHSQRKKRVANARPAGAEPVADPKGPGAAPPCEGNICPAHNLGSGEGPPMSQSTFANMGPNRPAGLMRHPSA
ncbi:hypothetical protein AAFF_G00175380 [Aldrovandia affinis]|uniref:Uncharacterized protein n=1 Tax=Aldrovandia affinis TaxID=143900 RepID=A0AAD7W7H0_9TELE|nr:hypothetical protein AAFF_G00175380 [Aldrovandia affinis]